jgi:hypothetical protein
LFWCLQRDNIGAHRIASPDSPRAPLPNAPGKPASTQSAILASTRLANPAIEFCS